MTADVTTGLVTSAVDAGIATVVVGNGRRRNALTRRGWTSLEQVVARLGADPGVRVIVVRGHGDTFCSGSDLTEWAGADHDLVEDSFDRMEAAFRAVERCQVPVVAVINGVAAGAGCQLALACDLRFMAETGRIGMPIARHGILTSPAFAARLAFLAGPAIARELLYTGQLLDGPAAAACGLVNRAVPQDLLDAQVAQIVTSISAQPGVAIRAAKQAVAASLPPIHSATAQRQGPAVSLPEFHASIAAFI